MAVHTKCSIIFQFTTVPLDPTIAVSHTGGFSEGYWQVGQMGAGDPTITSLINKRAQLLPKQSSIVGFRLGYYDLQARKMVPIGSAGAKLRAVGNPQFNLGGPDDAFMLNWANSTNPNTSRTRLRNWPDELQNQGEVGSAALAGLLGPILQQYQQRVIQDPWGFIGRDLLQPTMKVISLAGNSLTVDAPAPGLAVNDFIRFHRVYDQLANPVRGSFQVTNIGPAGPGGTPLTLSVAPGHAVINPSGLCRKDLLKFILITGGTLGRSTSKKVGSPSERYRGRRGAR